MSKSKQMRNQKQDFTPCEQLGYKVGDKFVVSKGIAGTFRVGETVWLYKDDGTSIPLFKGKTVRGFYLCDGEEGDYLSLNNVTPFVNEIIVSEENALHDLHVVQGTTVVPDNAEVATLTSKMEKQEAVSTLEYKLQAIKELSEHIEDLKADLQEQENTLKTWTEQIANQLQEYGFFVVPAAAEISQEEPMQEDVSSDKPLVITDWNWLREGDIIIARGREWKTENIDKQVVVNKIEKQGYEGNYRIRVQDYTGEGNDWGFDFEFVSRPSKTDK